MVGGDRKEDTVYVDLLDALLCMSTLILDACGRVLIYLEAEAAGRAVPDFAVHLLGDLLHAAEELGCRSLQVCGTLSAPHCTLLCFKSLLESHVQHHVK